MRIGIVFFLLTFHLPIFSQSTNGEIVNEVMERLSNELNVIDSIQYKSQMLFKGFGYDTFEVRNFLVSYKSNENNPLYGYDFEITEVFENGDTLTYMVLDTALYIIYNKSKQISEINLPEVVDLGSYLEYIRYSFIFNESLKPFLSARATDITLLDSIDYYYLVLNVNELETQELVVDKNSLLPNKFISVIKDPEFGLNQTTEIYYSFIPSFNKSSNSAFSTLYYLSSGYNHIVVQPELDTIQNISQNISKDNQALLLNYPFVLANGDTSKIIDYSSNYIVLDFWFASCLPCLKALPELNTLIESYSNSGLEIIGINCLDTETKVNLEDMIRKKNVQIPLLFGFRNLTETLGISSYPSYFLISPDRKIVYINGGIEAVKEILKQIFNKN